MTAAQSTELLVARGVSLSYGPSPALREVSFELARGDVVAVTGPSGSGKSTLLLCLAGILKPDKGEVRYGGRRIDRESEAARSRLRRTDFGVLFQFGQLVPELSAVENVALPLLLGGQRRREALRAARERLDRVGVGDVADKRPPELSGGQGQRVAVARALVTDPTVIFADEPTGALDVLSGEQVLVELTGAARELGAAVVLVTHDATVAAYADREVVLRDGRVEGADDERLVPAGQHRTHR